MHLTGKPASGPVCGPGGRPTLGTGIVECKAYPQTADAFSDEAVDAIAPGRP